jgi:hypothetical protein
MDDYLPTMLIIVLSVNVILFLGQSAIADLQPQVGENGQEFYNAQGSLLCKFDTNGCTGVTNSLSDSDPGAYLPSSEPISAGDGSVFTDMFSSIKQFFTETLGLGYLTDLLSAPKNFLGFLGVPAAFAWAVSALWYGFSLLIIIAFFWGR